MSSLPLARTRAAATSGGSSTKNTCVARTRSAQRRRADDVAPARITTASTWCRCPSSSSAAWNCASVVHAASSRSNTSKPDVLAVVVFPAPGGPQSNTTRRTQHLRSMAGPAAVGCRYRADHHGGARPGRGHSRSGPGRSTHPGAVAVPRGAHHDMTPRSVGSPAPNRVLQSRWEGAQFDGSHRRWGKSLCDFTCCSEHE